MSFWTARRFFTPYIRDQRHLGRSIVVFSMTDRIILVTGAGSGIGKVTALRLGELESVVIVVDQNGDTARETVQDLEKSNRKAVAMEADISNPDDVSRADVQRLLAAHTSSLRRKNHQALERQLHFGIDL